jgi:two-component sensor histidine kinase
VWADPDLFRRELAAHAERRYSHLFARLARKRDGVRCWMDATLLFSASLLVRYILWVWLEPATFMPFYPAIIAATLFCGWSQGVLVLLFSALANWYFFLEPFNSFENEDPHAVAALISFLLIGGFDIVMVAALCELVARLERAKHIQEDLFRELQHRVANNFQVVVALLRDAQRSLKDPAAASQTISKAEERIWAMSELHRRLHDGSALESGLEPLLIELLKEAFRDLPVEVAVHVDELSGLSIDQVTAMALLVNEAALNAAKHVFSNGLGSHFIVTLSKQQGGRIQLFVHDDGPGIELVPQTERLTLGMDIMRAFATQLGGPLRVLSNAGTTLIVEFAAHQPLLA